MGILDLLRGGQAQVPGSTQQPQGLGLLSQLLDPSVALPMAGALMGQQGNGQNFGNALSAAAPAMAQQKLDAQTNKTGEFLRKQDPRYGEMLDSGFEPKQVYEMYLQERKAQTAQNPFQDRAAAAQEYGLDPNSPEGRNFILSGDLPTARGGAMETGLVPQMMRDKNGKTIYVQATKDGRLIQSDVPDGFEPYDPYQRAYQTGAGSAAGKGHGEAQATYQSMASKMPGLESVITKLDDLSGKATYTLGGQALDSGMRQLGMDPRESAIARSDYIATVDNQVLPLLRDTFGAAFTVKEGETLRATLGDPNKTPAEKQVVLKAFIEQKRRDVEALAVQAGQGGDYNPQGGGVVDYSDYFGGQ